MQKVVRSLLFCFPSFAIYRMRVYIAGMPGKVIARITSMPVAAEKSEVSMAHRLTITDDA